MRPEQIRTDWPGLALSLLVPAVVVAGLVGAALQRVSWEDTPGWAWGLFMLVPLEGVRVWVMRITDDLFRQYRGPWQATMSFLGIIAFSTLFVLVLTMLPGRRSSAMSPSELATVLSNPWLWQMLLAPLALIVAETALGLLLFRGDARVEGARLEALAATSEFWFRWTLVNPLIAMLLVVGALVLGRSRAVDLIFDDLRAALFLYAAFYFAGKGILLAYLHTARFMRTGRCLIPGEKQEDIDDRRDVLSGDDRTLKELVDDSRRA